MTALLKPITLHINGRDHTLNVEPRWTLARVLREELGLVGTQIGCDRAECGACAVTINGRAVYACATLAIQAQGKDILTIEGLTELPNPKSQTPNPRFQSFDPRTTLAQDKPPTSNLQPPTPNSQLPSTNLQSSTFDLHPLQRAFVEHDAMQCGFCTSGFIMVAKALLDKNPKPSVDDIRYALYGNICRCGAYPKIIAAILDASGQHELAQSYERISRHATTALPPLDVLGTYVARHEAIDKVTGRVDFVSSLQLPNLAHAKVLRSPHPHARITHIDATRAEKATGVLAVVTHRDAPEALWSQPDARIMDDRVRYIGDEVAAVVAETEEQAADALKLIEVEYELLPAVFTAEDALREGAPPIHKGGNVAGTMSIERGDHAQGFADAEIVLAETFTFPPVHSAPLQARVAVAQWTDDGLTVWAASRAPFSLKERLATVFGLSREAVRVVVNVTGGSYGSKDESRITFLTALLAKQAQRPVRLWYSRMEEMTAGRNRPWGAIHLKVGAKRDGTLTAMDLQARFNTGGYASGMHSLGRGTGAIFDLYKCAARYTGLMYYTNLPPAGSYRALNAVHATFAVESLMDRLAETLGIDPIELRLKNCVRVGDLIMQVDGRKVEKPQPLSSSGFEECVRLGAEKIGWHNRMQIPNLESQVPNLKSPIPNPAQASQTSVANDQPSAIRHPLSAVSHRLRGIGFAPVIYGTGSDESDAEVELMPDGAINVLSGVSDVGVGTRTVLAMIAAEVLGVSYETVGIQTGDTALPYAPMQAGSRITFSVGWATKLAAESVREQLLKLAEPLFEMPVSELELKGGYVCAKNLTGRQDLSGLKHTIADIFKFAGRTTRIVGMGHATNQAKPAQQGFGAHFCEVEVAIETGDVKVLRYVAAHDVGRALNPHGVENQIYGLAQTLGQALTEDLLLDTTHGFTLNADLNQYLIPTTGDLPPIDVILVETNDPLGPFGAKGIGEPPLPPVAPAIANAIYNAIGVRFNALPINRDAMLKALHDQIGQV